MNERGYFREFVEAFLNMKRTDIANLLADLKKEGRIRHVGSRKKGYWEVVKGK